jgi:hypothetical protein
MLMGLLEDPDDFINHIRRYTTSLTTQMTFGYRTPTSDDQNLLDLFEVRCVHCRMQNKIETDSLLQNFEELSKISGDKVGGLA